MRRKSWELGRARGGQTCWSPNRNPSRGAVGTQSNVVTFNEMRKLMFRPLPREFTVEHEEDFGQHVLMQRSYISPQAERELPSRAHGICRSEVELRSQRKLLASERNERLSANARRAANESPVFATATDDNAPVGTIQSARFLFSDERLDYLKRFERHFGANYRALGEACAVVFGVPQMDEAREAWLQRFGGLDARTVAQDVEESIAELEESAQTLRSFSESDEGTSREHAVAIPGEVVDFSHVYADFAKYCAGRKSAVTYRTITQRVREDSLARHRSSWRDLMLRLVNEEFDSLTAADRAKMRVLSDRLATVRLFDAKLGEIVKDSVILAKAGEGNAGLSPAVASPRNPDRQRSPVYCSPVQTQYLRCVADPSGAFAGC